MCSFMRILHSYKREYTWRSRLQRGQTQFSGFIMPYIEIL